MADTGFNSPGATSNVDRGGEKSWSNPNNAQASDNNRAIVNCDKEDFSDWLRCTTFGITIPNGATITGIELTIERQEEATFHFINDSYIVLRKTAGQVGDNKASAAEWPWSDGTATYGGDGQMWGTTWSEAEIESNDFGVDISIINTDNIDSFEARIDHVQIKVYYTEAGGGYPQDVGGVATGNIASVGGVATANIEKVGGVS